MSGQRNQGSRGSKAKAKVQEEIYESNQDVRVEVENMENMEEEQNIGERIAEDIQVEAPMLIFAPDANQVDHQDNQVHNLMPQTLYQQLDYRLTRLQNHIFNNPNNQVQQPPAPRPKLKKRRKAIEIQKRYKCSYLICSKLYGSRSSAKNHMKLKHGLQKDQVIFVEDNDGYMIARGRYDDDEPRENRENRENRGNRDNNRRRNRDSGRSGMREI